VTVNDQLPFWTVDGQVYYNQFSAWLAVGSGNVDQAEFHIYDQAYNSIDWSQEPTPSWDELVRQRCLQLRARHQHLCLLYSAGRDSHHILRSFANNAIPLDEIIIVDHTLSPLKHPEVNAWMLPLAQQYVKNHNPNCKISQIDVDRNSFDAFFTESWTENSVMAGMNGQFQPANYPWLVTHYLGHRMPSGAGIITGVDKPRLLLSDGWIQSVFYDTVFDWYSSPNMAFEYFYVTPDLPELYVKQCHMVINWWEQHMPNIDAETIQKFVSDPRSGHYDNYNLACGRGPAVDINFQGQNGMNKYPSGNHAVFQILHRTAKENNWSSYHYWKENYDWIKRSTPQAFKTVTASGYENTKSNVFKEIPSKTRRLRAWNPAI
jgi:hypothetical protein